MNGLLWYIDIVVQRFVVLLYKVLISLVLVIYDEMQTSGVTKDHTNYIGLLFTVKLQAHYIWPEKKENVKFQVTEIST